LGSSYEFFSVIFIKKILLLNSTFFGGIATHPSSQRHQTADLIKRTHIKEIPSLSVRLCPVALDYKLYGMGESF
jgi:hypothetical protein